MTTQFIRYSTALKYTQIPVNIRPAMGYPTVYQQADDIGGVLNELAGAYLKELLLISAHAF